MAMTPQTPLSFIVIGEALIDMLPADEDGTYTVRPGGGPLNISVGLARLGQPTALAARLSADLLSTVLRRHLNGSGVDLRHVRPATEPTTIALVELSDGQASYRFSLDGPDFRWTREELDFLPGRARGVHFGSLASWMPPGDAAILAAVERVRGSGQVLISYDPNVRPSLQPDAEAARRQVELSVSQAHVVKASVEDVQWLYGTSEPAAIARRWLDLGAGLVVITAGVDGATAWTRPGLAVRRPAYPATVVDTVGAGDAFSSGLLNALARRDLLNPAAVIAGLEAGVLGALLDEAGLVAGLTCERPGANPPWRADINRLPRG
jgi:fructokinase